MMMRKLLLDPNKSFVKKSKPVSSMSRPDSKDIVCSFQEEAMLTNRKLENRKINYRKKFK